MTRRLCTFMGSGPGGGMRIQLHIGVLVLAGTLAACDNGKPSQDTAVVSGGALPRYSGEVTTRELPLKRGFYVSTDTACGKASNATLLLLRRDGIGGSRDFCESRSIEKIGETTYRVTQACAGFQDSHAEVDVVTYEIANDMRFVSRSDDGWERSFRYCEQSSLPEGWRHADISDLIQD